MLNLPIEHLLLRLFQQLILDDSCDDVVIDNDCSDNDRCDNDCRDDDRSDNLIEHYNPDDDRGDDLIEHYNPDDDRGDDLIEHYNPDDDRGDDDRSDLLLIVEHGCCDDHDHDDYHDYDILLRL